MASSELSTPRRGVGRSVLGAGLLAALAFLAATFVVGRLDAGLLSALAGPWAVQCWLGLAATMAAALLLRRWWTAATASLFVLWAGLVVGPTLLPADSGHPRDAFASPIRVLSMNVNLRNAPDGYSLEWLRSERPDVVAVIEMPHAWADAFAAMTDEYPYAYARPSDADAKGIGLYSRYPMVDVREETTCAECQPFVEATLEHPLGRIRVFAIHPLSPMTDERTQWRDTELATIAERCAASNVPTIVLGDFNETPYGGAFRDFLAVSGYSPSRSVEGFSPTWPSSYDHIEVPELLRIPIDHVVVSPHFATNSFHVGPQIGSDHLPIVAQLGLLNVGDQPRSVTHAEE